MMEEQPKEETALISDGIMEDRGVSVNEEETNSQCDSENEEETKCEGESENEETKCEGDSENEEREDKEKSVNGVNACPLAKEKGTAKKRDKRLSIFHRSLKAKSGHKKRKWKNVSSRSVS
ncbi:uncharacterized protein LOC133745086 [Rosa rugosa]|uniref:uncharacterized protein LOC133745086 n=1 Tax=Rosa rugosa TaxID=74645 RepID=UPI002B40F3AA|nr:uncharacterized protein LOC133745086 [Rosa rugosa]